MSETPESFSSEEKTNEEATPTPKTKYPSRPLSMSDLPPEAQGEANGGPLGCCLGTMVGLLLSLSVAFMSRFYAEPLAQFFGGNLANVTRVVMFIAAVLGVIIFGRLGWMLGKFAYKEYEPPVLDKRGRRIKSTAKTKQK